MALDSARQLAADSVEIDAHAAPQDALDRLAGVEQAVIRFESFKDGRGFSLAASLRGQGYDGELHALGPLLPDQEAALKRVGFTGVISTRPTTSGPARSGGFAHVYQPDPGGGAAMPAYIRRALAARRATAERLAKELEGAAPEVILQRALETYAGRIALLSSIGAVRYRDALASALKLTDLRTLTPDATEARHEDGDGRLYERDGAACCDLRKVRPLARALEPFDAIITGRKRYHGGERGALPAVEFDGERVKINPLAFLDPDQVAARFKALELPAHPLAEQGYASIGCWPCTGPADGAGSRAGRWAGQDREECGIFDPALTRRAERAASIRLI